MHTILLGFNRIYDGFTKFRQVSRDFIFDRILSGPFSLLVLRLVRMESSWH